MIEQRIADAHGGMVVTFLANEQKLTISRIGQVVHVIDVANSRQHHHDAIGYQPHAAHNALKLVVHLIAAFLVHSAQVVQEILLQRFGKREAICALIDEIFMLVKKQITQLSEGYILRLAHICGGKHIADASLETDDIKAEATEQTVLSVGYQATYLFGRSGQGYRHSGIVDLAILTVFLSAQTDLLVMESFAKHIRVVAVIRLERLTQSITLRLE